MMMMMMIMMMIMMIMMMMIARMRGNTNPLHYRHYKCYYHVPV